MTDEEIVTHFETFIDYENRRRRTRSWHGRWGAVPKRFLRWIKNEISDTELAQLGMPHFSECKAKFEGVDKHKFSLA